MQCCHLVATLPEFEEVNRSPIDGYQYLPVLTLEEATEEIISLVPNLEDYVSRAKNECNRSSTLLTTDESAAIYLYSMPIPFFSYLNQALRTEDRHTLEPWFAFLKLFITALEKLPSTKGNVWRGIAVSAHSVFTDGGVHIWWNVISCSTSLAVVERYLGKTGTLFAIDAIHGKYISEYSALPVEQEVLLMPGTRVQIMTGPFQFNNQLWIVSLKEW